METDMKPTPIGRFADTPSYEELQREVARLRLTGEEREAVDRVRIAFRDMDHNDMTMQQIEDYEAICDLLERTK
jgi:hypothetical protein